jgi:hypothetical protein
MTSRHGLRLVATSERSRRSNSSLLEKVRRSCSFRVDAAGQGPRLSRVRARHLLVEVAGLVPAGHRSHQVGVRKNVDVKEGETGAVHEALDGMTDHGREDGLSGLSHRLPQTHR